MTRCVTLPIRLSGNRLSCGSSQTCRSTEPRHIPNPRLRATCHWAEDRGRIRINGGDSNVCRWCRDIHSNGNLHFELDPTEYMPSVPDLRNLHRSPAEKEL